ncbi:MAG: binding-protein-dependent transport system inner rane component, partial [Chloroflexi bacterium]|nr:binding-protein-dependent transport system inner rane component [Chloroflexota bacterium]
MSNPIAANTIVPTTSEPDAQDALDTLMLTVRRRRLLLILRRPTSIIALIGTALLLVISVLGPRIVPYGPDQIDPINQFASPSSQHLFGTDDLGHDIFSRVIAGAHYSITAVAFVLIVALAVGLVVGAIAGYAGGLLEEVLMRITDIFLAFPGIVLALAIAAALHPGLTSAMAALAAVWWPTYARLVRGQVLAVKNNDYVDAARSLGASHFRIITSHILRNGIAPILVQLTLDMGNVLVTFAGLSFLGLGAEVGTAEWGAMVNAGQSYLLTNWWVATFPGLAIFLTALVLNLLGDTIQEVM